MSCLWIHNKCLWINLGELLEFICPNSSGTPLSQDALPSSRVESWALHMKWIIYLKPILKFQTINPSAMGNTISIPSVWLAKQLPNRNDRSFHARFHIFLLASLAQRICTSPSCTLAPALVDEWNTYVPWIEETLSMFSYIRIHGSRPNLRMRQRQQTWHQESHAKTGAEDVGVAVGGIAVTPTSCHVVPIAFRDPSVICSRITISHFTVSQGIPLTKLWFGVRAHAAIWPNFTFSSIISWVQWNVTQVCKASFLLYVWDPFCSEPCLLEQEQVTRVETPNR